MVFGTGYRVPGFGFRGLLVSSRWSLVVGPRTTDHGPWTMDYGLKTKSSTKLNMLKSVV